MPFCTSFKQIAIIYVLELRQRNVIPKTPSVVVNPVSAAAARPPLASGPTYPGRASHSAPGGPPERSLSAMAAQQSLMRRPVTPGTPVPGVGELPAHRGTTS